MEPYCDSDEEIFFGPVTPREAQIIKQRSHVSSTATDDVGALPDEPKEEGNSERKREDFDCTMDYMDYILEAEENESDSASDGKENVPPPVEVTDKLAEPLPVVHEETDSDGTRRDGASEPPERVSRPPTPMVDRPIVWGPYSPVTPDSSFRVAEPSVIGPVARGEPRRPADREPEPEADPELRTPALSAPPPPPRAVVKPAPRQPPPNIRFVKADGGDGSVRPRPKAASERRPANPIPAPLLRTRVGSAIKRKPVESPVRQYIEGFDGYGRRVTPQTQNVYPVMVPTTTLLTPRSAAREEPFPAAPPSGKKNVFQPLGEIGSAGRLVVGKDEGRAQVLTKIGRVPLTVDGETREYSVYEAE